MIPYGRQSIDDEDIRAVVSVLKGDWLTQGPHVQDFESAVAEYTRAEYAVAFANGTAALHAACSAGRIGPGDIVATSALTFSASAACALYVGAQPVFVDIDPATLNMDPDAIPPCDAMVAVHFAGLPLDLSVLKRRPRVVIEDAAHALGATTPWGPVGNCSHSDMCVFSFHPVKAVTTGEGGIVTTNSSHLADKLRRFRNHGIVKTPENGGWSYEIDSLGYNYRLTDMQAALGTSQMAKLERFIDRRGILAQRYRRHLDATSVVLPPAAEPGWRHAYHLFPIRVANRKHVYDELHKKGIAAQVHYVPLYRHPLYGATNGAGPQQMPNTEAAASQLLSIPLFPGLSLESQDKVIAELTKLVSSGTNAC